MEQVLRTSLYNIPAVWLALSFRVGTSVRRLAVLTELFRYPHPGKFWTSVTETDTAASFLTLSK